ncbi:hypothetical protein [Aureivirga sp. CE67]|uniref:hypothetical protein n=1 Tax=Aureivirga sp. CE67 TaxID=1788983 RepID=UPI0018CAD32B|nr:hypothetical protein [Aureivirga sp. CE67]
MYIKYIKNTKKSQWGWGGSITSKITIEDDYIYFNNNALNINFLTEASIEEKVFWISNNYYILTLVSNGNTYHISCTRKLIKKLKEKTNLTYSGKSLNILNNILYTGVLILGLYSIYKIIMPLL